VHLALRGGRRALSRAHPILERGRLQLAHARAEARGLC
jgi:hypothetical protein